MHQYKYLVLLFSLLVFCSCEKEEQLDNSLQAVDRQYNSTQEINLKELPSEVRGLFNIRLALNQKSNKGNASFGHVQIDSPIYRKAYEKTITYTVALSNTEAAHKNSGIQRHYDNLVVEYKPDGRVERHIFRYTPEADWLAGDRSFSDYSGQIEIFKLDGVQIAQTDLIDGTVVTHGKSPSKTQNRTGGCQTFILDAIVCTDGLYGYDGSCTYYYVPDCGSGGDGGFGDGNGPGDGDDNGDNPGDGAGPGDGNGGGSGTGDGTGGGDGIGSGDPIIDDDGDLIDDDDLLIGPSCDSFNFETTTTDAFWQNSAVQNIKFKVIVLSPHGNYVNFDILYSQPILFGVPTNMVTGGDISSGLAAELSAQALSVTISEVVNLYGNQPVSEMQIRLYFEQRLRYNYPIITNGGRVNFNPMTLPVTPTEYETDLYGTGNCD